MTNYNPQANKEWWTQQWIDLLNSYRFKKRLERARNYARQGKVLSIEFKDQKIIAKVQGTAPEPYELSLWLDTFTDEDWDYVIKTMSERAIFTAKLLAGEMPQNIEEVFAANGLRLFPFALDEVHSHCNCPDPARVCKHIAAVYYLLGDRFGEDPFVLFMLRGRAKEQILDTIRQQRSPNEEKNTDIKTSEKRKTTSISNPQETLKVTDFWQYDRPLEPSLAVITPPPSSETVLDILGPLNLGGNADGIMTYLKQVYKEVSQQAIMMGLKQGDDDN
ncbi:MAG: hypothetical protein SXA11_08005 [Cyanobacteriota bacterium]|nr:hypothetical protein [Cyanobacteriota bacterium]